MEMDPALKEAARNGDVKFLKEAFSKQSSEYFLTQTPTDEVNTPGGNIFHLAAWCDQKEFLVEAKNILPPDIQQQLLFQVDDHFNWIPLHSAAEESSGSHGIILVFKEMYALFSLSYEDGQNGLVKPWLACSSRNMTPLHLALKNDEDDEENEKENEECVLEILNMDPQLESCSIVDEDGNTPLSYSLKNNFDRVTEIILTSSLSLTGMFSSEKFLTPFGYAHNCSDSVVRLLVQKFADWIDKSDDKGFTVLHHLAEKGEARPCKLLLESGDNVEVKKKVFKQIIFMKELEVSDTPLHIAASKKDSELGQILIRGYMQQRGVGEGEIEELVLEESGPWRVKNNRGDTPLHMALYSTTKHEELALEILSIDPASRNILNNKGESLFFLAVWSGCVRVVLKILNIEVPRIGMIRSYNGRTVLHVLSFCPEEIGTMLLEKYWWIINVRDDSNKTALYYAKAAHTPWLVSLLTNPSRISKARFDWIEACKQGETFAVQAYVRNCEDLLSECRQENDTPLHHIKLPTFASCVRFLNLSMIRDLRNFIDHDGATPLHRALERKDMHLVKALLCDVGVKRTIKDNSGNTAMDLLAKLCTENNHWDEMCKVIGVNPYLKTSYIQPGTNLEQVRTNLSVVAALIVTITYVAVSTTPGGFNSATGKALLGEEPAFIVYLLADVTAMCTSMLVLFCLIWSMVSEPDVARVLVDRSVFILMVSLYSTLIAFGGGIYCILQHKQLWAAIVVIVVCSILAISAKRTILLKVVGKLVPAAATIREKKHDDLRSLEEGLARASSRKTGASSRKTAASSGKTV